MKLSQAGYVSMLNIFFGAMLGFLVCIAISTIMLVRQFTGGRPFKIGNGYYACREIKLDEQQRKYEQEEYISKEEKQIY